MTDPLMTYPPVWPAGGLPDARLRAEIGRWLTAAPLRELAIACGWAWPNRTEIESVAGTLAVQSADWDFRANRDERGAIPDGPLSINGRPVSDDFVVDAATRLGLVKADDDVHLDDSNEMIVLGAAVRGNVNRLHRALDLVSNRPHTPVTVLTAGRPLTRAELGQARDLGLTDHGLAGRPVTLEVDAIVAALRQARPDLTDRPTITGRLPRPIVADHKDAADRERQDRTASAQLSWPGFVVVVAPSGDPKARRTNTGDQLRHWANKGALGGRTVLAVTTQIYVPYQQIEAIRAIGRTVRCGIRVTGVDADSSLISTKRFAARDYLQEIRSTILAAQALLGELEPTARRSGSID